MLVEQGCRRNFAYRFMFRLKIWEISTSICINRLASCSILGTKRLNEELASREIPKRRRRTPGFTPFKQVEIPASWKLESRKLREAVRTSVAHCHYDDPSKRERLGNAVFEALSGQKTMKAAATTHEVPFTTLQTYFHRSRARMAKIMNDSDNTLPEQIQIPVSLTLSSSDMGNALAEEKVSPVESKKSKRLDSLLDILVGKVVESDTWVNGSSPPSNFSPRKLGSSKRKPKEVHRITPASTTKNECLEDDCESGWFSDQSQNRSVKTIITKSDEVTTKYNMEEVMAIIRSVISDSSLDENTKKSLRGIIGRILDKSLSIDDMCTFLRLDPALAEPNVYRVDQFLKFPDKTLYKNEIDFEKATENDSHALYLSSESQNCGCLDKIEKCVNDVCRFSHYPALQKEALRKAVTMVIRGECSVSGAASIMELPTSTVHPYVHRARAALEAFLPQQAEASGSERIADECVLRNSSISKEVEVVISDLMKFSSHDLNGQQKLHDALSEILTKDVPVTEVSSKYGIAVSAFQPYIMKARVLLGQSPFPTSSNIREIPAELYTKLPDGSGKHADEENNFNKMLTNTEPSQKTISVGDAVFTTVSTVHPNIAKDFSKHRKQRGNLLTRAEKSAIDSAHIENLQSSTNGGLNSSSDEFDDVSHIQPNVAKIRPRRGRRIGNISATSPEEMEPSSNNAIVSHVESGSDNSDDEFDGLPRSIRGVAKLLSDTKLDKLSTKDYAGTPESLAVKIDKVLRQYRFRGDRKKMRDGILEVLYKSKTLSEACKGNSLAPTTLSTYVRLVKVLINTEKTGVKGRVVITSSSSNKIAPADVENSQDFSIFSTELSNSTCFEQLTKKRSLPMESTSSIEEDTKIDNELLIQNVDVMMLHTKPIMNNLESFYKVLIAYLIEQQYRRSEEAQEKMRASLEYVLLDGLSVTEALKVHKGPTEHVLQVYLNRCREAKRCIRTEFPNFKSSVVQAINKNYITGKQDVRAVQMRNNTAGITKNSAIKRSSKRLQKREDNESMATEATIGTLKHLNLIFSEDFRKPLYDYLKELNDVNFPIENSLIVGLAKMIVDEFPMNEQIFFADSVWNQWLINYQALSIII
ncbi:Vacuolar membrane protease [Dirofilaria immitis]